eukprot:TRINITY_DN789_c0_g1_i1.p1 TRINITY_DN789_c0_g1~~TRINITY_DN789_c0_g1_i1.p1  ORF type:complete len:104 (+),score=40.67 TRINITY_DN789_c0_g1_i1:429-740(+)
MNSNQTPLGADSTAAVLVVVVEEEDTLLRNTLDSQEVVVEDSHHTPLVEVVEGQDGLVVVEEKEVHTLVEGRILEGLSDNSLTLGLMIQSKGGSGRRSSSSYI